MKSIERVLVPIILFIAISNTILAQDFKTFEKLEFGLNGLALAIEVPVANKITIEPSIGFGPSYHFANNDYVTASMNVTWALLQPSFHGSVYGKYFYNKTKRENKNKSLWLNSGNFVGLKVKYVSRSISSPNYVFSSSNTILTNINWGGQFNMGKHWIYSYSVGVGYGYNMDYPYGMFYPALDAKVAYVLPFFGKK